MNILKILLTLAQIVLGFVSLFVFALGVVDIVLGPTKVEWIIEQLNIPLSYSLTMIVGVVCMIASLYIYINRKKWFA